MGLIKTRFCQHDQITADIQIVKLISKNHKEDPDYWMVQIAPRCNQCQMPFEFVGLPVSVYTSSKEPSKTPDGLVASLPMRPGANRLIGFDKKEGLPIAG